MKSAHRLDRLLIVVAWDGATGAYTALRSIALAMPASHIDVFCFMGLEVDSPYGAFAQRLFDGRSTHIGIVLARGAYDLVLCVDTACAEAFDALKWTARAAPGVPTVCMSQNSKAELPQGRRAHKWIACSDASARVLQRATTAEVLVIPNGADTTLFRPADGTADSSRTPVIGWVGRSSDLVQKDPIALAIISDRALAAGLAVEIVDVGVQPEWFSIGEWFGSNALISFRHGLTRDEMAAWYRRVGSSGGVLLSTSRFEGLSLAMLEAVASGCPVVSTHVAGTEELVEAGWVFTSDRAGMVEGLWNQLQAVLDPPTHDAAVIRCRSIHASRYTAAAMAASYINVFAELVSSSSKGHPHPRRAVGATLAAAAQARLTVRRIRSGRS